MGYTNLSVIIKLENLKKSYNGKDIIKNVNLMIEKGEFICILGSSGCGKTTLLNLIGGFIEKDEGSITINNKEISKPIKECVMVFQEFDQLFPWKTLRENVEFPLKNSKVKISKDDLIKLSSKYIHMVKLEGFEDYYPLKLSGGMKQRTAIARALMTTPEVLLMDEPFGSLDFQTKSELHETLIDIWKKTKTTIIFVTHDIREALTLADRVVIIKDASIHYIMDNQDKSSAEEKIKEITRNLSP